MLTNSNTDQRKATRLIANPHTPSLSSPRAGFQPPVRRGQNPTPAVMTNKAYNPPAPKANTLATAPTFNPKNHPNPATSTTQNTQIRGGSATATPLRATGMLHSRA